MGKHTDQEDLLTARLYEEYLEYLKQESYSMEVLSFELWRSKYEDRNQ